MYLISYMASIDLKDAFYSKPIYGPHQKKKKFSIDENILKCVCMPNVFARAMRIFTKLTKVPFFHLRKKGHPSVELYMWMTRSCTSNQIYIWTNPENYIFGVYYWLNAPFS